LIKAHQPHGATQGSRGQANEQNIGNSDEANANSYKKLNQEQIFTNPTSQSPRLSTMMNIKERGIRFGSPGPDLATINAQHSSQVATAVNNSPSPSKEVGKQNQPIWLVNKKPTSLVVNYRSNQGKKLDKQSAGQTKRSKKMSPRQIIHDTVSEEKGLSETFNTDDKYNIVTIFSEQVELAERQEMINR
jgi:hypothetical protein